MELTERQVEIALRVVDGQSYRQIGRALWISPTTVRTHVSNIYHRLGIHGQRQGRGALILALQRLGHLIRPEPPPEPEGDLPPAWKAYLRAFDRHLRARTDESRAQMRTVFEAAMIDQGHEVRPEYPRRGRWSRPELVEAVRL